MFNPNDYFKVDNNPIEEEYKQSIERITEILKEIRLTKSKEKVSYMEYVSKLAQKILKYCQLEQTLTEDYFASKELEELLEENKKMFEEVLPENYDHSYCNPAFTVREFGEDIGRLLAFFYYRFRAYIPFAFKHKRYKMVEYNKIFIQVYEYIKTNDIIYDDLRKIITNYEFRDRTRDYKYTMHEEYDPEYQFYTDIILNADLTDPRYLFKTGQYITENEIRLSKFMNALPEEKLVALARTMVKAYQKGFDREDKELEKKSTVAFIYFLGIERLLRKVIKEFEKIGLKASIYNVNSTPYNKQVKFDQKFYWALFINEELVEQVIRDYTAGLEQSKKHLKEHSGVVYLQSFGDEPFAPKNKPENLKLSPDQTKLYQRMTREISSQYMNFAPRGETSFEIIAFPVPAIGEKFEAIFDKIVDINLTDSDGLEKIQQKIIDKLDKADHVIVKGKNGNKTDLVIKMQPLKNPKKETNYVNSGATVNIPAGEVFTTPQLKGTSGLLHVRETYQSGILYKNLQLTFEDGYTKEYTCGNFDSEKKNKEFVEQNLLFPHKTLPMGEFAIGTNTLAYVVSREYDIVDVLPILIYEKTGPHFAIGDTCFSNREDNIRKNRFNKKKVVACDNEKSILRLDKDRKSEAYTYKHSDIVMPFEDIDHITAVTTNGDKIDIIRDGLFVLEGTEELNKPLLS